MIAIDEVGYVPLAEVGAEFLFQVVAERAEKAAVILTTNLPFSEWTQVIPNARLCKALLDRIIKASSNEGAQGCANHFRAVYVRWTAPVLMHPAGVVGMNEAQRVTHYV